MHYIHVQFTFVWFFAEKITVHHVWKMNGTCDEYVKYLFSLNCDSNLYCCRLKRFICGKLRLALEIWNFQIEKLKFQKILTAIGGKCSSNASQYRKKITQKHRNAMHTISSWFAMKWRRLEKIFAHRSNPLTSQHTFSFVIFLLLSTAFRFFFQKFSISFQIFEFSGRSQSVPSSIGR